MGEDLGRVGVGKDDQNILYKFVNKSEVIKQKHGLKKGGV